ncbi:hypothetical protein [Streptomyces indicus]|uniref:Uncharacterized protein n=1 Tax=Streptomyces indicus TaxID=417292 RepID=A0A1G9EYZ9_9ACTN|nr:hypothetical protein [Streptomyces indicus]SDK81291.1 hypothetical protein SAMN05421806_112136 [Streptomyces indicus]
MGTDINGFIECKPHWSDTWTAAIDIEVLVGGRDYDGFGCLFGVRNYAGFRPVAAGRGLPGDVTEAVRQECDSWGGESPSWIGWDEVLAIDWDEPAERPDARIHEFRRGPDGDWRFVGKASWSREFARIAGLPEEPEPGYGGRVWREGTEWTGGSGDVLYRAVRMTRREAVRERGDWGRLWQVMEALASLHGEGNVRLVVWFDN